MKKEREHLKLVKNSSDRPTWKKAVRFLSKLIIGLIVLFLLKEGEVFFRISEIEVIGADELHTGEILAAAEIEEGISIFLLSEQGIAENIVKELPQAKNVTIKRSLPDKIVISLDEREKVGYVMTADGFWAIDKNAVPFAHTGKATAKHPLISGVDGSLVIPGDPLACSTREEALKSFFSAWPGETRLEVDKIDLSESYNLVAHTTNELEIWFGEGGDMEYKLKLIAKSIPYIDPDENTRLDVRCGNRLVVSSAKLIEKKGVDP